MLMFVEPTDANPASCPYIEGKKFIQRYSVLKDLSPKDFDFMLNNGWRHFGYYFFMPNCNVCNSCTPIRTLVNKFEPSKSQRKNLNKNNKNIKVVFKDLEFSDEVFEIYKKHSRTKFDQGASVKDFKESFFSDAISGNSKMSMFYLDSKLVGVGFIDISESGISSVYFCYDTDYSKLGLGVYSALKEIEYAKSLGKSYYYLGYYIEGNRSMEYKNRYTPCEFLNWNTGNWDRSISGRTV